MLIDRDDLGHRVDDPFRQREAGGEILKIRRGCHHDGIAQAVDLDGDRRFRHDRPVERMLTAIGGDAAERAIHRRRHDVSHRRRQGD